MEAIKPFAPVRRTFNDVEINVDPTTDGGYSINTFLSGTPHRIDELSFGTADRDVAVIAYRVIREGGRQGVKPEGIAEALRDALTNRLHEVQRRRDTPSRLRAEEINRVLDRLESTADQVLLAELGEALRTPTQVDRPRTLAELKRAYADDMARDRANRTGAAA